MLLIYLNYVHTLERHWLSTKCKDMPDGCCVAFFALLKNMLSPQQIQVHVAKQKRIIKY